MQILINLFLDTDLYSEESLPAISTVHQFVCMYCNCLCVSIFVLEPCNFYSNELLLFSYSIILNHLLIF